MGEEVSGIWDETPSLMNARNVQRSIWFCFVFLNFSPFPTAWVLWWGLQPSLGGGVPSAERPCHHGDSEGGTGRGLLRAARQSPVAAGPGETRHHGSAIRWSGRCFTSGGSSSEAGRMGALDSNPMGCTGPSPLE